MTAHAADLFAVLIQLVLLPSELVFLVLVRYACGILNFLFTYKSALTMPLRSIRLMIADIIATTGCRPMDERVISYPFGGGATPLASK